MTKQEMNLIIKVLREKNAKDEFIEFIENSADKNIIDIICFHENLINLLPKQIISMYEEEIIKNAEKILEIAVIKDLNLLDTILKRSDIHSYSSIVKTIIGKYDNPEELYDKIPDIFTESNVLNYAKVPLRIDFINSCNVSNIKEGFFTNQVVTLPIVTGALNNDKNRIFRDIEEASKESRVNLSEKVIICYWHKFDIKFLLNNYSIPKKILKRVVYHINRNEDSVISLLKNTKLEEDFVSKFIPENLLQYYFAYNPYFEEDMLIDFYKNRKDINWIYVNKYLNLSKFPKYIKRLFDENLTDTIEQNLIDHSKTDTIFNVATLRDIGIDLSCIEEYLCRKSLGLSSLIHNI